MLALYLLKKMRLELIQHSSAAINSVYIFKDFLEDKSYLEHLTKIIETYTEKDEMKNETNVKANMTNYQKLLSDNQFLYLHKKILEILITAYTLRTPHPHEKITFDIIESWGMRHKKGEYTTNHIHKTTFSGAFYFKVPSPTTMWFEDYHEGCGLEENMLVIFPGFTKHSVFPHTGDKDRISMAFNIKTS
jgi:hypothetical protein